MLRTKTFYASLVLAAMLVPTVYFLTRYVAAHLLYAGSGALGQACQERGTDPAAIGQGQETPAQTYYISCGGFLN